MDRIYDLTLISITILPFLIFVDKLGRMTSKKRARAYEQRRKAILHLILTNDQARAYLYLKCNRHSIRAVLSYVVLFLFAWLRSLNLPESEMTTTSGIPTSFLPPLFDMVVNIAVFVGGVSLHRSWKAYDLIKEAFLRRDPNQMIDESAKAYFDAI